MKFHAVSPGIPLLLGYVAHILRLENRGCLEELFYNLNLH